MTCAIVAMLVLTAFSYSPRVSENNGDPWTTACGTRPFIGSVAVSQDLFRTEGFRCGDTVLVFAGGRWRWYVVNDTMHRRHTATIDVWDPVTQGAVRFGRQVALVCRERDAR